MVAFEGENFGEAFDNEIKTGQNKKQPKRGRHQGRMIHGSPIIKLGTSLSEKNKETRSSLPIENLQNVTVTDAQAKKILTKPITVSAGIGKQPYAVGQVVELMPESSAAVKAKIIGVTPKGGRFSLTLEHHKES